MRSRQRCVFGFTLVEILVVVVILGIAAAMIIPQIGNRDDLRAASMAREIMADIAYAQSRAVSLQKPQYVWFDATTNQYKVLDQISPSQNIITHPVNKTPFTISLGSGRHDDLKDVVLDQISFDGRPVLYFDDLGTPHSYDPTTLSTSTLAAGSVRLRSHAYTLTISVQPYSGEMKVN